MPPCRRRYHRWTRHVVVLSPKPTSKPSSTPSATNRRSLARQECPAHPRPSAAAPGWRPILLPAPPATPDRLARRQLLFQLTNSTPQRVDLVQRRLVLFRIEPCPVFELMLDLLAARVGPLGTLLFSLEPALQETDMPRQREILPLQVPNQCNHRLELLDRDAVVALGLPGHDHLGRLGFFVDCRRWITREENPPAPPRPYRGEHPVADLPAERCFRYPEHACGCRDRNPARVDHRALARYRYAPRVRPVRRGLNRWVQRSSDHSAMILLRSRPSIMSAWLRADGPASSTRSRRGFALHSTPSICPQPRSPWPVTVTSCGRRASAGPIASGASPPLHALCTRSAQSPNR